MHSHMAQGTCVSMATGRAGLWVCLKAGMHANMHGGRARGQAARRREAHTLVCVQPGRGASFKLPYLRWFLTTWRMALVSFLTRHSGWEASSSSEAWRARRLLLRLLLVPVVGRLLGPSLARRAPSALK